jgi:putative addiction module component (TIGR02574 family)
MPYNKQDILQLPVEEKLQLAEEIWQSIDEKDLPKSDAEIQIAEERYQAYLKNPNAGMSWEEFRKKIFDKYGF